MMLTGAAAANRTKSALRHMKIRNVCVYCGSLAGSDPRFASAAEQFGEIIAASGLRLVYGGGGIGLMGVLARAVLRQGGEVLGVIPDFLRDRGKALSEASEIILTEDMHDRKRVMFDRADAFAALPGGTGTLEETIEMITWVQIGRHQKPIVLANIHRFWDPLVNLLEHMAAAGFLHASANGGALYQVANDVGSILPALQNSATAIPHSLPGRPDRNESL